MGLFDKKSGKSDDFDSPVEQVSLNAPAPATRTPPATAKEVTMEAAPPPAPEYGIDRAIELMRLLPQDNIELVVQVVKKTLESTNVKIGSIIDDATRKQKSIEGRIKVLKGEIDELEKEIATRKQEIETLEADHKETTTVKERLELAERLTSKGSPAAAGGGKV